MKYRKKPVIVEAITFDELIEHGRHNGANIVNGMPWSWEYNGHPITHESDDCYLIPTLEGTMKMGRNDMLITGVQGEIYPCKRDIFEATYEPANALTAERQVVRLPFGQAVAALKDGKRVARKGWNGKGMFLFLLPAGDGIPTKAIHDPALREVIESEVGGDTFDALGSIRMFTADKKILTGWLASQTDLLAEDWEIL